MDGEKNRQQNTQTREEIEKQEQETDRLMRKLKRSENSVRNYQFFVLKVLLMLLVIWVLFFRIVGLTHAPGNDMYPRVDAGDLVLFYRLDTDVKAQDIAVISKVTPDSGGEPQLFVSRVVAVAGDTVEIADGRLMVNGSAMVESNIFYSTYPYKGYTEYPLTLGEDECFVLSDSRHNGTDSRYFGPVKKDEIEGTVITILRRNNL